MKFEWRKQEKDLYIPKQTPMLITPDFVTKEIVDRAFETVRKKKPNPLLDDVSFDAIEDGQPRRSCHTSINYGVERCIWNRKCQRSDCIFV